ncbi:hypothetical protein AURDEDRAFT_165856 [Auricularia subglabra TFB-10046 SS5]|nr:hypothetical protein AURDEDRAFT_165856 [Auricularia subglabra TFB-10046 SS5]
MSLPEWLRKPLLSARFQEFRLGEVAAIHPREEQSALGVLAGLPDDCWLQVLQWLPMTDLISASHVCRRWRALALQNTCLWAHLDIFTRGELVSEGFDQLDAPAPGLGIKTHSNLRLVRNILSRSADMPLRLNVVVWDTLVSRAFIHELMAFLRCILHRLTSLRVEDHWSLLVVYHFCDLQWEFPALRELDLDSTYFSLDDNRARKRILGSGRFPMLDTLDIGCSVQSSDLPFWAGVEGVSPLDGECLYCDTLADRLSSLTLHWRPDPRTPDLLPLPDLLESIRVVHISNPRGTRPRAVCAPYLALVYTDSTIALLDAQSGLELKWEITVYDRHFDAVEVSFPAFARGRAEIDWHAVPCSLTSLIVDAALWEDVLHGLPEAAQVAKNHALCCRLVLSRQLLPCR